MIFQGATRTYGIKNPNLSSRPARNFLSDCWRNPCAQQLNRVEHPVVGHRADAQLQQESLVLKQLVLEQNLFNHLVGTANEIGTSQQARSVELLARERRPAALPANFIHGLLK
ncbi:MAG: hypothetical protein H6661_12375, partial [Ardenticatenaceae bacterium]|nr:hypothetical protein [Ardenticatenaceae bacterium]